MQLGGGASGQVYAARWQGNDCAVKRFMVAGTRHAARRQDPHRPPLPLLLLLLLLFIIIIRNRRMITLLHPFVKKY
jgi:hypothetical protein